MGAARTSLSFAVKSYRRFHLSNDVYLYGFFHNQSDVEQDPLNELFVLFAGSSSVKVFTPHVDLLLSRLPAADIVPFLSKFFITEGSKGLIIPLPSSFLLMSSSLFSQVRQVHIFVVKEVGYF